MFEVNLAVSRDSLGNSYICPASFVSARWSFYLYWKELAKYLQRWFFYWCLVHVFLFMWHKSLELAVQAKEHVCNLCCTGVLALCESSDWVRNRIILMCINTYKFSSCYKKNCVFFFTFCKKVYFLLSILRASCSDKKKLPQIIRGRQTSRARQYKPL